MYTLMKPAGGNMGGVSRMKTKVKISNSAKKISSIK